MTTAYESYQTYSALKNHFTSSHYDYFRYNGKVKSTPTSFEQRKDKIFFQKLAKRGNEVKNFVLANLVHNEKIWIRDIAYTPEAEVIYKDWSKRQQSLTYVFTQDLKKMEAKFGANFTIHAQQHPVLLKLYLSKQICIETMCILLDITGAKVKWDKKLEYDPIWVKLKTKVEKYTPFIHYDREKIKQICLGAFEE